MPPVDLGSEGRTGKEVEELLDSANITVNKNTVPNETRSPFVTSGIRIGTAAVTSRGLAEEDMDVIAQCIADIIENGVEAVPAAKAKVQAITAKYPLYK